MVCLRRLARKPSPTGGGSSRTPHSLRGLVLRRSSEVSATGGGDSPRGDGGRAVAAFTAGIPSLGGLGPARAADCGPSPRPSPGTSLQPQSSAWSQGHACAEHLEPHLCRGSRGRAEPPSARRAAARASLSPAPSPPSGVQWSWSKGVSGPKGGPAPAPVGRTCSRLAVAVPCPHLLPKALPRLLWAPGMSMGARPASPRPPPLGPRGLGVVRAGRPAHQRLPGSLRAAFVSSFSA